MPKEYANNDLEKIMRVLSRNISPRIIVKINDKDMKDSVVLLREHNLGERDDETINCKYLSELLMN